MFYSISVGEVPTGTYGDIFSLVCKSSCTNIWYSQQISNFIFFPIERNILFLSGSLWKWYGKLKHILKFEQKCLLMLIADIILLFCDTKLLHI